MTQYKISPRAFPLSRTGVHLIKIRESNECQSALWLTVIRTSEHIVKGQ